MPILPADTADERVTDDKWKAARAAEDADCCTAGPAHDHAGEICPRGATCHCARPIGHPVPVELPRPRARR